MNINELISIIKKKLEHEIIMEDIKIEDKSFLHKNHKNNQKDKFHLKITIRSRELKEMNKINSNKRIFRILEKEMKNYIHSLQLLIS